MATTDAFITTSRDSARSIDRVEFSGPKNENVVVRLVDGTAFGIKDIVESSADLRQNCGHVQCQQHCLQICRFWKHHSWLPHREKQYMQMLVLEAAEKQKKGCECSYMKN
jgi:hypothetical protein